MWLFKVKTVLNFLVDLASGKFEYIKTNFNEFSRKEKQYEKYSRSATCDHKRNARDACSWPSDMSS